MKHILDSYLNKEMDRKEFLKQIGLMLLAVFGVSSLLKYLADQAGSGLQRKTDTGYGSHNYGGQEKPHRRLS